MESTSTETTEQPSSRVKYTTISLRAIDAMKLDAYCDLMKDKNPDKQRFRCKTIRRALTLFATTGGFLQMLKRKHKIKVPYIPGESESINISLDASHLNMLQRIKKEKRIRISTVISIALNGLYKDEKISFESAD